MPQEITRTQIEKYTVYTGPTAESFSPIMAGITYPDPAYEILVYRRPLCVFEYVLSGRGHIERNGSILTVNAGDAYILTAGTYHHYYSDKVDPWTKIWFNVSGSLVQHLLSDYGLDGVTLIPRFHNETPLTRILDAFTADPVHSADKLAVLLHQYIQELADFLANTVPINPTALAMPHPAISIPRTDTDSDAGLRITYIHGVYRHYDLSIGSSHRKDTGREYITAQFIRNLKSRAESSRIQPDRADYH